MPSSFRNVRICVAVDLALEVELRKWMTVAVALAALVGKGIAARSMSSGKLKSPPKTGKLRTLLMGVALQLQPAVLTECLLVLVSSCNFDDFVCKATEVFALHCLVASLGKSDEGRF